MSNWLDFCKRELELAGLFDNEEDFYGGMTGKAVMELCEVFDKQNHSGMSANIVSQIFNKLVKHQPLTPLTGERDEWVKVGENIYQNRRCPSVFKENNKAYQCDYYIFIDENGVAYTSKESRKYINKFPYMPSHEYVKVNSSSEQMNKTS